MKAVEFKALILDRLDAIEDAELHAAMPTARDEDMFNELVEAFRHGCLAFPGLTWEEFGRMGRSRSTHRRRRGKPKGDLRQRAATPLSRAARDVDVIKEMWKAMKPSARSAPPVSPIEIAAERHDVDEVVLGEHVRRPNSRRPDRLIRRP